MDSLNDKKATFSDFRNKVVDLQNRKILISNYFGSDQEKDLQVSPNCGGFGRIRHFKRIISPDWPLDPLPIDPACKALNIPPTDMVRAQVFQIAACNLRCWYCFVPYNLLDANIRHSSWLSAANLIDFYIEQPDPPLVIDLSGGNPELVPEWVPWMMRELIIRNLEQKVYLWSDDNLTTDYLWRFLSDEDLELITSYKNYSRVCCFKGFDAQSFAFNTHADQALFNQQFDLMRRLISLRIDIYAYVTFTTLSLENISDKMKEFIDRLQKIDQNLPLRTIPLKIQEFTPVKNRLLSYAQEAIQNQFIVAEAWCKELDLRYSSQERGRMIVENMLNVTN